VTIEERQK